MGQVRQVVGEHGAARAALGVLGDLHSRVQEEAVDDQLSTTVEQVEQAHLARGTFEAIVVLDSDHGQLAALRSERVPRAGQLFLLDQQRLALGVPLCFGHDSGWDGHRPPLRRTRTDGVQIAAAPVH